MVDRYDFSSHKFYIPEPKINSPEDVGVFLQSEAFAELMGLI